MKYLYIYRYSFKQRLIYRYTVLARIVSSLIIFFIQYNLWQSLIGAGYKQGVSLSEMISYLIINSIVLTLSDSNISSVIENGIRDGSISMHLLRPMSYKKYLFCTVLGENTYKLLTSVLPVFIAGLLFFHISLPADSISFLLFLLSLVIGILIMFELTFLTGLLAFWMQKTWFLHFYIRGFLTFFGGTVIPLWFYPEFLDRLTYYLPFRYITFEAINFYLGKTPPARVPYIICTALLWLLVLHLLGSLMWKYAFKKLSVNGG